MAGGEFLWLVSKHFCRRRIYERHSLPQVQAVDAFARGLQDRLVLTTQAFELYLVPLALRYVLDLGDAVHGLALGITHQRGVQEYPRHVPALVKATLLYLVGADLPAEAWAHIFEAAVQVVGMGDAL